MGERAAAIFPFAIAVALPPAGLIMGIVQLSQEDRELGIRLIVVACIAAAIWAWLLV